MVASVSDDKVPNYDTFTCFSCDTVLSLSPGNSERSTEGEADE